MPHWIPTGSKNRHGPHSYEVGPQIVPHTGPLLPETRITLGHRGGPFCPLAMVDRSTPY
jgi:hypothetical protein